MDPLRKVDQGYSRTEILQTTQSPECATAARQVPSNPLFDCSRSASRSVVPALKRFDDLRRAIPAPPAVSMAVQLKADGPELGLLATVQSHDNLIGTKNPSLGCTNMGLYSHWAIIARRYKRRFRAYDRISRDDPVRGPSSRRRCSS